MPLSEDENRILNQMEQRLYAEDPASAQRIASTTLPRYLSRNCRRAALGFLAGFVIVVVAFATVWFVGLIGFVVMVAAAVALVHNLRLMGRHGWRQLTEGLQGRSLGDVVGDTGRQLRRRLGRDDDSD